MRRSTASLVLSGVIAGAVVGGGAAWLAGDDAPPAGGAAAPVTTAGAAPATPPAVTTTSPPVYVDPAEVLIGPMSLVPRELEVDGDRLVFRYETRVIAPFSADGPLLIVDSPGEFDPLTFPLVLPTAWTLLTDAGEVPVTPATPGSGSVTFPVPDGFTTAGVRGLRIDSYRLATPLRVPLQISPGDAATHAIAPGLGARIVTLLEQGTGWLVVVEMDGEAGAHAEDVVVEGVGPDWTRATLSLLGTPRWTMEYRGPSLPDPIPLEARGVYWVEIAVPVDVDVSEL